MKWEDLTADERGIGRKKDAADAETIGGQ